MGRGSGKGLLSAHPARFVALVFLAAIAAGTVLLALPIATVGEQPTDVGAAFFTATSAVCVTGLAVYDVGSYLSGFGQAVVLVLAQRRVRGRRAWCRARHSRSRCFRRLRRRPKTGQPACRQPPSSPNAHSELSWPSSFRQGEVWATPG